MSWDNAITPLIGAPFEWGGRGPYAYDCWGLTEEALRRVGRGLPITFMELTQDDVTQRIKTEIASGRWLKVNKPEPGDVVVLSTHRRVHHVGLTLPNGILHTTEKQGAVIQREIHLRALGYRRVEYYRWAG